MRGGSDVRLPHLSVFSRPFVNGAEGRARASVITLRDGLEMSGGRAEATAHGSRCRIAFPTDINADSTGYLAILKQHAADANRVMNAAQKAFFQAQADYQVVRSKQVRWRWFLTSNRGFQQYV